MDPQSRILLEQSWMALSDAQAVLGSLVDTQTGVYVGCMYQEFTQLQYNLGYKIRLPPFPPRLFQSSIIICPCNPEPSISSIS